MSYLYILDINPLLIISFVNIFSHSVGYLFLLSMISFAMQKFLSLTRSHLFIFAFISIILRGGSKKKKKTLSDLSQKVLCLCFTLAVYSI